MEPETNNPSAAFIEYCHLLIDLHQANESGDEAEAERICDKADKPAWDMLGHEMTAAQNFSASLDGIWAIAKGEVPGDIYAENRKLREMVQKVAGEPGCGTFQEESAELLRSIDEAAYAR